MNRATSILCLALMTAAILPAAAEGASKHVSVSTTPIVFPGAPAKPRIKHVRIIKYKQDISGWEKKGFFSRLLSALSGGDADKPLISVPYGLWVKDGKLFVTDTDAARLTVIDLKTGDSFHVGEAGDGRLIAPTEVAVNDAGTIFVTDAGDHTLKAYSPKGDLLWKNGRTGGQEGSLNRPTGLAIALDGSLLVADKGNRRVVAFSKDGTFIRDMCRHALQEPLALPNPVNVAAFPDGRFLVADPLISRIHIFTSTGAAVSGFGERGDKPGYLGRPRGLAVDSDGNIHVVDGVFHRVQMFDQQGQLLMWYANPGGGMAGLALPSGIFIDKDDAVYVADTRNRRIQVFQYLSYPDAKR